MRCANVLAIVALIAVVVVVEYRALLPLMVPSGTGARVAASPPCEIDLIGACPHLHPVDLACPRFLTFVLTEVCGLGQKVTEVLFGWHMAHAINATYVFDFALFSKSPHAPYDWAVNYFGLAEGEALSVEAAKQLYNPTVVNLCPYTQPRPKHECNVLYRVPNFYCCSTNCFESLPGVYDNGKACLRAKTLTAAARLPPAPTPLNLHHIAVVWHLRVGDFKIHENDAGFFNTVWAFLSQALGPMPLHNYFVGEFRDAIANTFPFIASFPNSTVLAVPVIDSMRIFQDADVLVGSGSSFPQVAALASTTMVFLNHYPKHPYGGMEHMSDAPFLWPNGTIAATRNQLRALVLEKTCARRKRLRLALWWTLSYCP